MYDPGVCIITFIIGAGKSAWSEKSVVCNVKDQSLPHCLRNQTYKRVNLKICFVCSFQMWAELVLLVYVSSSSLCVWLQYRDSEVVGKFQVLFFIYNIIFYLARWKSFLNIANPLGESFKIFWDIKVFFISTWTDSTWTDVQINKFIVKRNACFIMNVTHFSSFTFWGSISLDYPVKGLRGNDTTSLRLVLTKLAQYSVLF